MRLNHLLFITIALLSFSSLTNAAKFTNAEHSYASLLVSEDYDSLAMVSRYIVRDGNKNTDFLDLVAEVLWLNASKDLGKETNGKSAAGKLSKLIEVFEEAELSRYKTMLTQLLKQSNNKKIISYLKDALDELDKKDTKQYVVGTISIKQVKEALRKKINADKNKRTAEIFLLIKRIDRMNNIYNALGVPDKVNLGNGLGRGKKRTYLQAVYNGLGSIQFRIGKKIDKKQSGPLVAYLKVGILESDKVSSKVLKSLRQLIFNANAVDLRTAARHLYHNKIKNEAVLDLLAERILLSASTKTEDWAYIDSIAWLCEVIRVSGNTRYRNTMLKLEETAVNKKLKKYAVSALKELLDEGKPQFTKWKSKPKKNSK